MKRAATVLAVALLAATGCGDDATFDAQSFVEAANSEGAGLELREPLHSGREEVEITGVSLAALEAEDGAKHQRSGGSVIVAEDDEAAVAEFARCEQAITLVCYRAANVVLAIEGEVGSPELAGVDTAIRALGAD